MNKYNRTFEWIQFPEGKARFSGGIRGGDETGHETYAVQLEEKVRYGEIGNIFLPNGNDYSVEVISFGYGMVENVGSPHPNARGTYTENQLKLVQSLVVRLIHEGFLFEVRPSVLVEYPNARYMGKILFREGWARQIHAQNAQLNAQGQQGPTLGVR